MAWINLLTESPRASRFEENRVRSKANKKCETLSFDEQQDFRNTYLGKNYKINPHTDLLDDDLPDPMPDTSAEVWPTYIGNSEWPVDPEHIGAMLCSRGGDTATADRNVEDASARQVATESLRHVFVNVGAAPQPLEKAHPGKK